MKVLAFLMSSGLPCIFAVGAVYLASKGLEGWGWCIFAALLTSVSVIV